MSHEPSWSLLMIEWEVNYHLAACVLACGYNETWKKRIFINLNDPVLYILCSVPSNAAVDTWRPSTPHPPPSLPQTKSFCLFKTMHRLNSTDVTLEWRWRPPQTQSSNSTAALCKVIPAAGLRAAAWRSELTRGEPSHSCTSCQRKIGKVYRIATASQS